jgi:NEDD4-binding protein 2
MSWYKSSNSKLTNKTLFILCSPSGGGKSFKAQQLQKQFGGEIFSTDNFWMKDGKYNFDIKKLGIAHNWNKSKVEEAMKNGVNPIIVDNTNIMAKERKPYVLLAQQYGYDVRFEKPDQRTDESGKTLYDENGKFNYEFLKGNNTHNVPDEAVKSMVDKFDYRMNVDDMLKEKDF